MSVLYTAIEIESAEVPARKMATILRDGMHLMASEHRLVTMGKHFKKNTETAPGGGYGYVPRSARYVEQKLRRFGTDDPNVRTGKLRRETKSNSFVTATQYRSTLKFRFSRPINDQQRAELEAVTPEEMADAAKTGQQHVATEFAKPSNQLKRKRKIT